MVVPVRILSIGLIYLFQNNSYSIGPWAKNLLNKQLNKKKQNKTKQKEGKYERTMKAIP